ncbi:MAG: HD domain-containing protein [SAR324 cluster bacterium]|nr:HD domain-containing protein [SAR324 cluster bacterium]
MTPLERVPLIEAVFVFWKKPLGNDYQAYHGHVYRVYNYTLFQMETEDRIVHEKVAIASAFHDIGIWLDRTFDYLEPSIAHAREFLENSGRTLWGDEIAKMIDNHHKLIPYRGEFGAMVEAFRKADLLDLSMGLLGPKIPSAFTKEVRRMFPYEGFHKVLLGVGTQWIKKNPLNPFPMIKP